MSNGKGDGEFTVYSEFALCGSGMIANQRNLLNTIEVGLMVSPTKRVLVADGIQTAPTKDWEDPEFIARGNWRVGNKVPINVYAGDRPVCQCHSEEDARMIVEAVNRMGK